MSTRGLVGYFSFVVAMLPALLAVLVIGIDSGAFAVVLVIVLWALIFVELALLGRMIVKTGASNDVIRRTIQALHLPAATWGLGVGLLALGGSRTWLALGIGIVTLSALILSLQSSRQAAAPSGSDLGSTTR